MVVPHGLSCSVACGIFPDQGSNPCPLHRQTDSQPLRHQGSLGGGGGGVGAVVLKTLKEPGSREGCKEPSPYLHPS